jgi:uncharacterized membrane protein YkoI
MSVAGGRWVVAGLVVALGAAGPWAPSRSLAREQLVAAPRSEPSGNQDRIIEAVQKRFNARVVRVAETQVNGRAALELRLLSDQRVWTIVVDAQSGQVLTGG